MFSSLCLRSARPLLGLLAVVVAFGLQGVEAGADEETRPAPPRPGLFEAWIGLEGDDPFAEGAADAERVALFPAPARLLLRTRPIPWGRIVPVAPVMGGRQLHDWDALDRYVRAWQAGGHEVVLVLEPSAAWIDEPPGETAYVARARQDLEDHEATRLTEEAQHGLRPLPPEGWGAWQDFVRSVVERYDRDGREDAPDLRRPLRFVQILEAPFDPRRWRGDPADYVRLLHHARLGAREASDAVEVVHGGVGVPVLAAEDARDLRGIDRTLARRGVHQPPAARFADRWAFEFLAGTLGLSRVYDAVVVAGHGHLEDEADAVSLLRRLLAFEGRDAVEVWVGRVPGNRLAVSARGRPAGPSPEELRVRARWLSTARLADHLEHERALTWLHRGEAYDVVRTLAAARAAGALRVFFGHGGTEGVDGDLPLAAFGFREQDGRWVRRPAGWALGQAAERLGQPVAARRLDVSGGATAVRFDLPRGVAAPFVVVVHGDPDLDWAGDPREDEVTRPVALRLDPGVYRIEAVRLGAAPPAQERRAAPDGVLALDLGPGPVYVWPES